MTDYTTHVRVAENGTLIAYVNGLRQAERAHELGYGAPVNPDARQLAAAAADELSFRAAVFELLTPEPPEIGIDEAAIEGTEPEPDAGPELDI